MTLNEGMDFSRLLSQEAKARRPSPLKTCMNYFGDPNIIFLGSGLPRSEYFPWDDLSVAAPDMDADIKDGSVRAIKAEIKREGVAKTASAEGIKDIPLGRSLQYGTSVGQPELMEYIREHTNIVHQMQYDDWDLMVTAGNTLSWDYTLRIFCDRGDPILAEENCFSSALTAAEARGVVVVPVIMDEDGIVPELLEELLEKWDKIHPGMCKPKLLYTVPTGQNPTGSCLPTDRRERIYKIAQKHDFLIIEDEPYYFLQMEAYERDVSKRTERHFGDHDEFLSSLVKTFLSLDTDGRVIRLDSFSKVLAPGTRLGWITASKSLLRHFLLLQETCVQAPSGFSTSIVSGTLHRWGQEGYLKWLMKIRAEYSRMRDNAMDAVHKYVPDVPFVRVNPTVAGMFFTITLDASAHPEFETKYGGDPLKLESAMHETMINSGVLFVPGSWFYVIDHTAEEEFEPASSTRNKHEIFFRGTFAATDAEMLTEGIRRFGETVRSEFSL